MSLWDESFEATLVEHVDESFFQNHLVEFLVECRTIVGSHFLDTYRLTDGILDAAYLADLRDMPIGIHDDLDLFLSALMTVEGEGRLRFMGDTCHSGRVAEDIAVHQQELLATHILSSHP